MLFWGVEVRALRLPRGGIYLKWLSPSMSSLHRAIVLASVCLDRGLTLHYKGIHRPKVPGRSRSLSAASKAAWSITPAAGPITAVHCTNANTAYHAPPFDLE